jgi:hypothetical protein
MEATEVYRVRRECAGRVQQRRCPPAVVKVRSPIGLDGDITVTRHSNDIMPATSIGEFVDDKLAGHPWIGAYCGLLYDIAGAMRLGRQAAVAEVRKARTLPPAEQWHLFETLMAWCNSAANVMGDTEPLQVTRAVLLEWRRLRLTEHQPPPPERRDPPRPPKATEPVPAGRHPYWH